MRPHITRARAALGMGAIAPPSPPSAPPPRPAARPGAAAGAGRRADRRGRRREGDSHACASLARA